MSNFLGFNRIFYNSAGMFAVLPPFQSKFARYIPDIRQVPFCHLTGPSNFLIRLDCACLKAVFIVRHPDAHFESRCSFFVPLQRHLRPISSLNTEPSSIIDQLSCTKCHEDYKRRCLSGNQIMRIQLMDSV